MTMEFGSIERELFIEAAPEIVFDVVSDPQQVQEWWPDEARYERVPGANGQISFGDCNAGGHVAEFAVLEVDPPRTFSFRWTHPAGEVAAEGNSLLVTFELVPAPGGTLLRMSETGFREMGWEAAVLEAQYNDHVNGWGIFLPRIAPYAASLLTRS
jgi:uncharacterized protein YndB with AHSA1/START domain